jgi:hypothetical protein
MAEMAVLRVFFSICTVVCAVAGNRDLLSSSLSFSHRTSIGTTGGKRPVGASDIHRQRMCSVAQLPLVSFPYSIVRHVAAFIRAGGGVLTEVPADKAIANPAKAQ